MADVYVKTVEGGETTTPTSSHYVELDDGTNSTYLSIVNLAIYVWNYLTSLTAKTTLVDADQIPLADSAASNAGKKITWANFMAQAAAYTQTLTNKTLTTPTIASFTNAQHDHSGASSGGVASYPPGFLYGLTLSNNVSDATNDIDIAAGKCRDSTDAANLILSASLTKRLDAAWAVGTNQGGLDTGSIANTTYHIWLIKRSDTGVVDALFSASASSPTMPASYDYKRRIGSIVRASSAIKTFIQDGDRFQWAATPVQDVNVTNPGTSAVTRTLTVPTGIRVLAKVSVLGYGTSAAANPQGVYLSDLSTTDVAAGTAVASVNVYTDVAGITQLGDVVDVWTNTSAQIRSRIQVSAAGTGLIIGTMGWMDDRGRSS